jgi:hypothetical protein
MKFEIPIRRAGAEQAGIEIERLAELRKDGYNMNAWRLVEHSGTHLDAPIHFSEAGKDIAGIEAAMLIAPLARSARIALKKGENRQKKAGGPSRTARWARNITHPRGTTLRTEPQYGKSMTHGRNYALI